KPGRSCLALTTLKQVMAARRCSLPLDWLLLHRTQEHAMFNKPNLFPKAGDNAPNRPGAPGTPGGARGPATGPQEPQAQRPGAVAQAAAGVPTPATAAGEASARGREEPGKGDSRLIVGPEVKLRGAEILDCDTLVVEG